jgi:hypothetical protein
MILADKLLHLKLGALLALAIAADIALAVYVSPPLAISLGALALAWGVERYQAIRREGVASYADMAAGAVPGQVAALAWGWLIGWT